MKNRKRFILLLMLVLSATAYGKVLFFDTWHQIFDMDPVGFMFEKSMVMESPYEFYFIEKKGEFQDTYVEGHIAVALNDSVWLINSKYLKENFSGDGSMLRGFVPFFFDEKVAYAVYKPLMYEFCDVEYYYIDFQNGSVRKVNKKYLLELLNDYHDLLMRYEGMQDNKKHQIIEDYFLKYIDQASQDCMRPYIVELVD